MISFADDSSIVLKCTKGNDEYVSSKIDKKLISIQNFLAANNLKLNINKTQLLRCASRQQHVGNRGDKILLEARDENGDKIKPSDSAKILGITFNKTLSWTNHLEVGKDSLIQKLKKKLGALKFTSRYASYSAKMKLANGCIMSNIVYGLQIWGLHCSKTVLKKVQSVQTNTLKWITSKYNCSLRELLHETKWLSIYQLTIYHSIILWWKINNNLYPVRLLERMLVVQNTEARIQLTERIWSRKAEFHYRMVEPILGGNQKISTVKRLLKKWILNNIPIFEE